VPCSNLAKERFLTIPHESAEYIDKAFRKCYFYNIGHLQALTVCASLIYLQELRRENTFAFFVLKF
jgi:hypothetical protein